ncbi:MAG: hypothetical protein AB9866_21000 [Syntrophobacteraceae bacterium]
MEHSHFPDHARPLNTALTRGKYLQALPVRFALCPFPHLEISQNVGVTPTDNSLHIDADFSKAKDLGSSGTSAAKSSSRHQFCHQLLQTFKNGGRFSRKNGNCLLLLPTDGETFV